MQYLPFKSEPYRIKMSMLVLQYLRDYRAITNGLRSTLSSKHSLFTLLPHESRQIEVEYPQELSVDLLHVETEGWNVRPIFVTVMEKRR